MVAQGNTTTMLSSSGNPSMVGQSVTFTATVTVAGGGNAPATGTVTFRDNSVSLGTASVSTTNTATMTTAALTIAGSPHTITAVYSGDSNVSGGPAANSIVATVNKATPAIAWSTPVDIIYGTALTGTQLNATASVPGTLAYSMASGTVLSVGASQALQVTFTPTDTTDYTSASATVYINVDNLSVTSLTPNPYGTGFQVAFNGTLDTSPLSLADVSAEGQFRAAVNGSILVNQVGGTSQITFLDTSGTGGTNLSPLPHGVLPNGTYTVTLTSSGFQQANGNLLGGGTNYTTTFTVNNPAAPWSSACPISHAAGQAVNVPATSTGIPLQVGNTGAGVVSVTSLTMNLVYNPNLLTITGGSVASGMPTGATVSVTTTVPGTAVIDFASTTPVLVNAGSVATFARLTATVPSTATYGAKEILDLQGLAINNSSTGVVADDALHAVGYAGDATMGFNYSVEDAMDVARVAIGLNPGFAAWPLLDPVVLADVEGNGVVNATNAMYISRYAIGLPDAQVPALPSVVTPVMSGPDPQLSVVSCQLSDAGSVVQVPVMLNHSDGLTAVDLAIAYDTSRLTVSAADVQRGSLTGTFDSFTVSVDAAAGIIRIEGYRSAGPLDGLGSGSVALIDFQVKANAPAGAAAINLLQNAGTTWTSVGRHGRTGEQLPLRSGAAAKQCGGQRAGRADRRGAKG